MGREAIVAVRLSQHTVIGSFVYTREELVKALGGYKGNLSRSLQTLESRGFIVIGRSPGGNAHHLRLTAEGHQKATEL